MKIKEKLAILRNYYEITRKSGHTSLMKNGTDNYDRDKLILGLKKCESSFLNVKSNELIPWDNLNALIGQKKPLAIDNAIIYEILNETLEYIKELEMYKEQINDIQKIIK